MRPVGWRYEGYRHSLARRGVRTKLEKQKLGMSMLEDPFKIVRSVPKGKRLPGYNAEKGDEPVGMIPDQTRVFTDQHEAMDYAERLRKRGQTPMVIVKGDKITVTYFEDGGLFARKRRFNLRTAKGWRQKMRKEWKDKLKGGLADKRKPSQFNQKQLRKGMRVEREHTSDPKIAKEIAMDHLSEDSAYYRKLEAMERGPRHPTEFGKGRMPLRLRHLGGGYLR